MHLKVHSAYSLLEGASSIDELLLAAAAQGHRALALTDHDGMYGSMEFARSAKEGVTLKHGDEEIAFGDADYQGANERANAKSGVRWNIACW